MKKPRLLIKWSNLSIRVSEKGFLAKRSVPTAWLRRQVNLLTKDNNFDESWLILVDRFSEELYGLGDLTPYQKVQQNDSEYFQKNGITLKLESELYNANLLNKPVPRLPSAIIAKEICARKVQISTNIQMDDMEWEGLALKALELFADEASFLNELCDDYEVTCLTSSKEKLDKYFLFRQIFNYRYNLSIY